MESKNIPPFFSVIICTRDRPELFQRALESVIVQSCKDREICVVVDGSSDDNLNSYRELEQHYQGVRFHYAAQRPNGNGQSYSINTAAYLAKGRYLCFLDDDDQWSDTEHLALARDAIEATPDQADLYYTHQKAYYPDGSERREPLWISSLITGAKNYPKIGTGVYRVNIDFMLSCTGFAHANCTIINRSFYQSIGGMDEGIRYENDRDFYLRSLDSARCILLSSRYSSRHYIPDQQKQDNLSTLGTSLDRKLYQLRVFDKGIAQSKKRSSIDYCRKAKTAELKNMTHILKREKRYRAAAYYARETLAGGFSVKWFTYSLYLGLRAIKKSQD